MKPRRNEEHEAMAGGWWPVVGGRWLVVGGWWLVVGGWYLNLASHISHLARRISNLKSQISNFLCCANLFLMLVCAFAPLPLAAHGVTSEQIKQLTTQIQRAPNNADLYVRRGELHRQLGNAKAALEDFDTAQKLAPDRLEIDMYRARLHLDANVPELAQLVLDRYLKLRPQHTEAVLLRAQVNTQLGARTQAIQDYSTVIARLAQPKPELFVARAQLQLTTNQLEAALNGLDEGIAKLGALVTLQLLAVEVEGARKRWDAALRRLDTIAAQSPRKENWLVQRAEILLQAGRHDEAQQTLSAALQLIAALPDHLRRAPALRELEAKAKMLQTKKSGSNSAPGTN